jgi:hypothetical protein
MSSVNTPFTQGGSSGQWRTFSTSGWIRVTEPPEALAEEDFLQVNIHVIKQ